MHAELSKLINKVLYNSKYDNQNYRMEFRIHKNFQ